MPESQGCQSGLLTGSICPQGSHFRPGSGVRAVPARLDEAVPVRWCRGYQQSSRHKSTQDRAAGTKAQAGGQLSAPLACREHERWEFMPAMPRSDLTGEGFQQSPSPVAIPTPAFPGRTRQVSHLHFTSAAQQGLPFPAAHTQIPCRTCSRSSSAPSLQKRCWSSPCKSPTQRKRFVPPTPLYLQWAVGLYWAAACPTAAPSVSPAATFIAAPNNEIPNTVRSKGHKALVRGSAGRNAPPRWSPVTLEMHRLNHWSSILQRKVLQHVGFQTLGS